MITDWLVGLPPLLVYVALFAVVAGESSGLPLPGETSLIAAAVLATQPGTVTIDVDTDLQFMAPLVTDQFGGSVDYGGEVTWAVNGGGTISPTGKFSATTAGDWVVSATVNGKTGNSNVKVIVGKVPRIATAPAADPNPVMGDTSALTVLGSDDKGESKLTYVWSAVNPAASAAAGPSAVLSRGPERARRS